MCVNGVEFLQSKARSEVGIVSLTLKDNAFEIHDEFVISSRESSTFFSKTVKL